MNENDLLNVNVEVSNKHLHLSQADQDALFGPGYEMKIVKNLSQTGQWAAEEVVTVKGPKGEMQLRVLGPCRKETQVELAATDAFKLGLPAAFVLSGKLDGTPGCTLAGPKGEVTLSKGVIVPLRHIHIRDTEAAERGLKHGDIVSVRVEGPRGVTFAETHVRVDPSFRMNMHLDTDEGNAAGISRGGKGLIIKP